MLQPTQTGYTDQPLPAGTQQEYRLFYRTPAGQSLPTHTLGITWTEIEHWRVRHFGTSANLGHAADTSSPADDGWPNRIKFLLGLDPHRALDPGAFRPIPLPDGGLALQLPALQLPIPDSLEVWFSNDLTQWDPLPIITAQPSGPHTLLQVAPPEPLSFPVFFRLQAP